jgi:hypothetical protein
MAGQAAAVMGYDTLLCNLMDSDDGVIAIATPGISRLRTQS